MIKKFLFSLLLALILVPVIVNATTFADFNFYEDGGDNSTLENKGFTNVSEGDKWSLHKWTLTSGDDTANFTSLTMGGVAPFAGKSMFNPKYGTGGDHPYAFNYDLGGKGYPKCISWYTATNAGNDYPFLQFKNGSGDYRWWIGIQANSQWDARWYSGGGSTISNIEAYSANAWERFAICENSSGSFLFHDDGDDGTWEQQGSDTGAKAQLMDIQRISTTLDYGDPDEYMAHDMIIGWNWSSSGSGSDLDRPDDPSPPLPPNFTAVTNTTSGVFGATVTSTIPSQCTLWTNTTLSIGTGPIDYSSYLIYDNFVDSNGTALASHTPLKTITGGWVDYAAGLVINNNMVEPAQDKSSRINVTGSSSLFSFRGTYRVDLGGTDTWQLETWDRPFVNRNAAVLGPSSSNSKFRYRSGGWVAMTNTAIDETTYTVQLALDNTARKYNVTIYYVNGTLFDSQLDIAYDHASDAEMIGITYANADATTEYGLMNFSAFNGHIKPAEPSGSNQYIWGSNETKSYSSGTPFTFTSIGTGQTNVKWNIACNDTSGNNVWATSNFQGNDRISSYDSTNMKDYIFYDTFNDTDHLLLTSHIPTKYQNLTANWTSSGSGWKIRENVANSSTDADKSAIAFNRPVNTTLAIWRKITTGINSNIQIGTPTGTTEDGCHISYACGANCIRFRIASADPTDSGAIAGFDSSLWHRIIMTYDNSTQKCHFKLYNSSNQLVYTKYNYGVLATTNGQGVKIYATNTAGSPSFIDNMTVYQGDTQPLDYTYGNYTTTLTSTVTVTNPRNWTNDRLTYLMSATSSQAGSCTLYGNWSGSWAKNETKTGISASTPFNFTSITFTNVGNNYFWGVNCSMSDGTTGWSDNTTFVTADTLIPTISNQRNYTNNRLTYIFSGQSSEAGSCTLYGNWTGSWLKNETKTGITANTLFNFTAITFGNNGYNYSWGLNCSDAVGNSGWGSNLSFETKDIRPYFTAHTNTSSGIFGGTFYSFVDNVINCTLYTNYSASLGAKSYLFDDFDDGTVNSSINTRTEDAACCDSPPCLTESSSYIVSVGKSNTGTCGSNINCGMNKTTPNIQSWGDYSAEITLYNVYNSNCAAGEAYFEIWNNTKLIVADFLAHTTTKTNYTFTYNADTKMFNWTGGGTNLSGKYKYGDGLFIGIRCFAGLTTITIYVDGVNVTSEGGQFTYIWGKNETKYDVANGTPFTFTDLAMKGKNILWNVNCSDSISNKWQTDNFKGNSPDGNYTKYLSDVPVINISALINPYTPYPGPYITDDTTPSVNITCETADCSYVRISNSNQSFASMTTDCTQQGTSKYYTCTLSVAQALPSSGYIYFSSNGTYGDAWTTSPLSMYITLDNTPPYIYDQRNYTNDRVVYIFSANMTDYGNCTLYGNWSGSWVKNESVNIATANISFNFTQIRFVNDTVNNYVWGINCSDWLGNVNWGSNITFTTADIVTPILDSQRNYTNNRLSYLFSANLSESGSCSLYGNWSGTWSKNETKSVVANQIFNFTGITFTNEGFHYVWGMNCSDAYGNHVVGTNTSFITVDTLAPTCLIINALPLVYNDTYNGNYELSVNCTDKWGVNTSRILLTKTIEGFIFSPQNYWTIRYPANTLAQTGGAMWPEQIFRAYKRGKPNNWYENYRGLFFDNFTYGVMTNTTDPFTRITTSLNHAIINASYANLKAAVFRQSVPLDRVTLMQSTHWSQEITKNNPVLVKTMSLQAIRNESNFTWTFFRNVNYTATPNKVLRGGICNKSIENATGQIPPNFIPSLDKNCAYVTSFTPAQLDVKSFTEYNSSYSSGSYSVVNGLFAGVYFTPTMYVYYETDATNKPYLIWYSNATVPNSNVSFNNASLAWTSTNGGTTWTSKPWTYDLWTTSVRTAGDESSQGIYVEDNYGNNLTNFTLLHRDIEVVDHPISSPFIEYYASVLSKDYDLNETHKGVMSIYVDTSVDPDFVDGVNHSAYLIYAQNNSVAYVINATFNTTGNNNMNITFNTLLVPDGIYKVNITAISYNNSLDKESFLPFENFTIDNIPPYWSNNNTNFTLVSLNTTNFDDYGFGAWKYDSATVLSTSWKTTGNASVALGSSLGSSLNLTLDLTGFESMVFDWKGSSGFGPFIANLTIDGNTVLVTSDTEVRDQTIPLSYVGAKLISFIVVDGSIGSSIYVDSIRFMKPGQTVKYMDNTKFNLKMTDLIKLGSYIFAHNESGSWVNSTATLMDNTSYTATVTKQFGQPNGTQIEWRWYFNDSASNTNHTDIWYTRIADTVPVFSALPNQSVDEDSGRQYMVNLSTYCSDVDNNTLSYIAFYNSSEVGIDIMPNKTIYFTPFPNWYGNSTIKVQCSDSELAVNTSFVVEVLPINDGPVWNYSIYNKTVSQGFAPYTHLSNLSSYIYDVENSTISFEAYYNSSEINVQIPNNTHLNISEKYMWYGNTTIIITANDTTGGLSNTSFVIQVLPETNPPAYYSPSYFIEDQNITYFDDFGWGAWSYTPGMEIWTNYHTSGNASVNFDAAPGNLSMLIDLSDFSNVTFDAQVVINPLELYINDTLVFSSNDGGNNLSVALNYNGVYIVRFSTADGGATSIDTIRFSVAPKVNRVANMSISWSDYNLSTWIFSLNDSGVWSNRTPVKFSTSIERIESTYKIGQPNGTRIEWKFYANDSNGNWNVSDVYAFVVENTAPTWNSLINNVSIQEDSSETFVADLGTKCEDLDNNTLYYTAFWNTTGMNVSIKANSSLYVIPYEDLPGVFTTKVQCSDTEFGTNLSFITNISATGPNITNQLTYARDYNTDFIFSARVDENATCTLYGNWTGSWAENETKTVYDGVQFNFTEVPFPHNIYAFYKWGINCSDAYGALTWGSNMSFILGQEYVYLNGMNSSAAYEHGTPINITGLGTCLSIDFPDYGSNYSCTGFPTYVNTVVNTTYTYTFKYKSGENVSGCTTRTATSLSDIVYPNNDLCFEEVDNRSNLVSFTMNISADRPVTNLTINYGSQELVSLPGTLKGDTLNQTIFWDNTIAKNITFSDAGASIQKVNLTTQDYVSECFFNISGSDVDSRNALSSTYYLNDTSLINETVNLDSPWGYFDNFEWNRTGRWACLGGYIDLWAYCSTTGGCGPACDGEYGYQRTTHIPCNYWYSETDGDTVLNFTKYLSRPGYNSCKVVEEGKSQTMYATDFDLRQHSDVNVEFEYNEWYSCGRFGCYGHDPRFTLYITDGITKLTAYTVTTPSKGNLSLKRVGPYLWNVYLNGSGVDSVSTSSLNNTAWYIGFYSNIKVGQSGAQDIGVQQYEDVFIKNIQTSGIYPMYNGTENRTLWVNETMNYTSQIMNETIDYLYGVTLTADSVVSFGDSIDYYVSNDNMTTWEKTLSGVKHIFTSTGKKLAYRVGFTLGSNQSGSYVRNIKLDIVPASVNGVIIDVGEDGTDYTYTGILNSTTSPVLVNITNTEYNDYIDTYCGGTICPVPIIFYTGSSGILGLSDLQCKNTITQLTLNKTVVENTNGSINLDVNFTGGRVNFTDLRLKDYGNHDINISMITFGGLISKNAHVKWSDYDINITSANINNVNFYPSSPTSRNVQPFSQTSTVSILNLTTNNYHMEPVNFTMYLNKTVDCYNITVSRTNSKSAGVQLQNLTWVTIDKNLQYNNLTKLWMWLDLGCSYTSMKHINLDWHYRMCCANCTCSEEVI